jgi:two-component system cell cycle response regulator DivK
MANDDLLIVDDNPVNLKLTKILLIQEGYRVQTVGNAEEALKLLETYKPRLILMDIQLPGMDGLELTRRLKSTPDTRHIKVIALTAYAMKGDEEKARAAGCDDYITKPIDTQALPKMVAEHLFPYQKEQ